MKVKKTNDFTTDKINITSVKTLEATNVHKSSIGHIKNT